MHVLVQTCSLTRSCHRPGDIFCFNSVEEYNAFFNGTIELTGIEETGNFTDPAEIQALLSQASIMQKKYEQVGRKCLHSTNGSLLRYLGTAAAVRDMVSLADAIDGPNVPINYVGVSYGTLIGSWFVNSESCLPCLLGPHSRRSCLVFPEVRSPNDLRMPAPKLTYGLACGTRHR